MKEKYDTKVEEMTEISFLLFILAGGALLLAVLYVFYKLMIFFAHGWEVLVYLLIEKNGFLGLILMVLLFVMVLPLAIILTLYLGYRDQKNEDRFWKNVTEEIKKRKSTE
jgi:uncharacterized membrane protein